VKIRKRTHRRGAEGTGGRIDWIEEMRLCALFKPICPPLTFLCDSAVNLLF